MIQFTKSGPAKYLLVLFASVAAAVAVGLWLGYTGWLLAAALGAHLSWHLYRLGQMYSWLHDHRRRPRPSGGKGIWEDTFVAIQRMKLESRDRRRRMAGLVRELRDASAALPDALVILDADDAIIWANPAASPMLGVSSAQDRGRPLGNLVRDLRISNWLSEAPDRSSELTLDSQRQPGRTLRLRLFPYTNTHRLVIARDVTDLARVDTMRKDFVANVSHELRTPLTVISGYIETMAEEVSEDWQPIVAKVESQTSRMRCIVEDLLMLSRLEAGDQDDADGLVNVPSLINSVVVEGRALSEGRHTIRVDVEANLHLSGSAADLHGAFLNLVTNAVRYTQDGGEIMIRWGLDGDSALLSVIDNGPGVAEQHLARLTERFYRVSTDRSRNSGGTGLGLAIVKHVLALHGAELEIQSTPGEGSAFLCRFPLDRTLRDWPKTQRVG
ncbi:MAG: phosphate regulon sensor histidine kinase PhoR [Pseudomonadota bacterium]